MEQELIPVDGHKNLYRDKNTGAIVNYDSFEYEQYIRLKKNKMQEKEEMQKMKKDIDEIKSLLREILNANN